MANNLRISFNNGIFRIERDLQVIAQGRDVETALSNATDGAFEARDLWMAAEIIENMMGPLSASHGQIHTREP